MRKHETKAEIAAFAALITLGSCFYFSHSGDDDAEAGRIRSRRYQSILSTADGGDAAILPDGGDAAADGGDVPADGGDAAADGGDAAADGGDAAADGGDAAADGGDAAADGGDAAADGGDATVSPLDTPSFTGTLICAWDWVNYTSGSLNPLTAYAGTSGSACSVTENPLPNQTGANATTGFTFIGNRTSWLMNNSTSGGWAQAALFSLPSTTGNLLVRITGKSPAAWGTFTMFTLQGESNAALIKMNCDATPRCIGQYDDGPGSVSSGIVTSVSTSKDFLADVYLDDAAHKITYCYNGTCATSATASGTSSILTPDSIGIGGSITGTALWTGSGLDIQLWYSVSGWTTTVHTNDCAAITGGACSP